MTKKNIKETIKGLQSDEDYILLNNPLSSPKFIRTIGKGQNKKELSINETYTPKVFYEIVSRLKPEHLEGIKRTETVKFDINIKQFLEEIGANIKNYRHLIDSVDALQSTLLKWKEGHETITVPIITKSIHNDKTGKIELYVDSDLAKRVLEVREKENFSFLKSNVFRLQNAQAIKLYPFFKSWANYGKGYEVELERFKSDFGYNTSGYLRFALFKQKVLTPAIEEINEKTDITVTYEPTGNNLDGLRPRVTGLIFYIQNKEKLIKEMGEKLKNQEREIKNTPTQIANPIDKVNFQKPHQQAINSPSEADIQQLADKLKLNPEQVQVIKNKLNSDFIRVYEVLQGCIIESKNKSINSYIAYILGSIDTLGLGLWKTQQAKAKKIEAEKIEEQKRQTLSMIQKEYNDQKNNKFREIYSQATTEQIEEYIEYFRTKTHKTGTNFYIDLSNNTIKDLGIHTIGLELADQAGFGIEYRQSNFRNEVLDKYGLQIGFNENEEISIISLFEQPQDEPITKPIEATPPTEPTTPLPQSRESEQTQIENFSQNNEPGKMTSQTTTNDQDDQDDQPEAPKSIGNLIKKYLPGFK